MAARGPRTDDHDCRFFAMAPSPGDLRIIADKPRHGYEIIKESRSAWRRLQPSPVIYPTLTLLENSVTSPSPRRGRRKLHEITDAGRAFLTANGPAVERCSPACGGQSAARRTRAANRPPMENLKLALRLRLGASVDRGPGDRRRPRSTRRTSVSGLTRFPNGKKSAQ